MMLRLHVVVVVVVGMLIATPAPAASFTDDVLARWPHLQRHWLQLQNKRVTTPAPTPTVADQSHELAEDETAAAAAATTGPSHEGGTLKPAPGMLTIAQAKEKLRARRIKSRKRIDQLQQELELYQQHKRTDTSTSAPSTTSTPGLRESTAEVKKHIQTMAGAICSRPAARLVYVRDEYQTMANVRYLPGCTWLHRCSDDVGCCPDESKTCSPSHIESVSLPFFVLTMNGLETRRTVARLTFENHTACECVGRNSDLMPRTQPIVDREDETKQLSRDNTEKSQRARAEQQQLINDDANVGHDKIQMHHAPRAGSGADTRRRHRHQHQRRRRLVHHNASKCPADYTHAPVAGKVQCVCETRYSRGRCNRLKRGLLHFSSHDRQCINESRCRLPACDFGRYVTLLGRCPRREEQVA